MRWRSSTRRCLRRLPLNQRWVPVPRWWRPKLLWYSSSDACGLTLPNAVQLVVTPFLPREQPALGVSSLAAVLAQRGVETQVVYLNLAYLRICGLALYDVIAHSFSPTLF